MKADAKTEAEITALLNKVVNAYETQNMETWLSLFADDPDVVFYGSGADEKRIGLTEIKLQAERDWAQSETIAIKLGWRSISAAGPVAWVACDAEFVPTIEGQAVPQPPARMTWVFEERADTWVIMQGHASFTSAQAEGASWIPPTA